MDNPLNSVEAGVAAGREEGARLPREKTQINDFILGMPSRTRSPVLFLNIGVKKLLQILYDLKKGMLQHQGGRSWQPFGPRNTVFDPKKHFFVQRFPKSA